MRVSFLLLFFTFLLSCHKEDEIVKIGEEYIGNTTAVINNDTIDLKIEMYKNNNFYNIFFYYDSQLGNRLFTLSIFNLSLDIQKTKFDSIIRSHITYNRGIDVIIGYYDIIKTDSIEDYIEISAYNEKTMEVSGVVQGSFKINSVINPNYPVPDSVIIKDCTFKTKINYK